MNRHEYKRQNEERDARRQARILEAKKLPEFRRGWRGYTRWRPTWWNTPADRFAFFVAVFTGALAIVAYFQLSAMRHTDDAINDQLKEMRLQTATTRAQIRANVAPQGIVTRAVSQNGVTGWTLNPTWKNTGGTDAVDLRSWWALQIVEGAEWTAKRCPAVAAPVNGTSSEILPPQSGIAQVSAFLSTTDATRAINHQIAVFAAGHVEYFDIFPDDPIHHVDWCILVIPNDIPNNIFSFLNMSQSTK